MSPRVHGLAFPVRPEHVDVRKHFYDAFDNRETEISANWIVRLCQELNSWGPFTQAELDAFYHRKYPDGTFLFNRLLGASGWIERDADGYHVTEGFITRCFAASPKTT